jgi:hypothetical protein
LWWLAGVWSKYSWCRSIILLWICGDSLGYEVSTPGVVRVAGLNFRTSACESWCSHAASLKCCGSHVMLCVWAGSTRRCEGLWCLNVQGSHSPWIWSHHNESNFRNYSSNERHNIISKQTRIFTFASRNTSNIFMTCKLSAVWSISYDGTSRVETDSSRDTFCTSLFFSASINLQHHRCYAASVVNFPLHVKNYALTELCGGKKKKKPSTRTDEWYTLATWTMGIWKRFTA